MLNFTYQSPTKIIFGRDAMQHIGESVKSYGHKVFVTYGGGSIKKNGIYQKVMEQLTDFEVQEFGGIEPNPRVETLRQAVSQAKTFQPDLILAVGGGSTIDGSKLIAASIPNDADPWALVMDPKLITRTVPLASVLTLAATGSEMNRNAVITNWTENIKKNIPNSAAIPVFSILDPQNTFTVPADQTAFGVIDAFSHVLEQYLNTTTDAPLQDRFAESILLTLIENGPIAIRKPANYEARANLMWAATLALNGLIGAGVSQDWATHGIEHELSAFHDIPHAAGLAIITPRWMQVAYPPKSAKFVQYGRRIWNLSGSDSDIIQASIRQTFDFFASLGAKMHLRELGIEPTHFDTMVTRLAGKIGEIPLTADQIRIVLTQCL